MIKIGFIGLGWIADWHFKAMQRCGEFDIIGAATGSSNVEKFKSRCREMSIRPYESIHSLLEDPTIEAVAILSPTSCHFQQAMQALDAGKHLLVEKPVVLEEEQYIKLKKKGDSLGKIVFPAHNFLYRPVVKKAREIIVDGMLGEISYASFRSVHFISEEASGGWRTRETISGGGAMIDSGMHLVYQSIYLMGYPSVLSSFGANKHLKQLENEDISQISLQYPNQSIGLIMQSWASNDGGAGEIRIQGTQGNILISDALYLNDRKIEDDADYGNSFYHMAKYFAHCIRSEKKPLSDMEDALKAFKLVKKAYQSAKEKQTFLL